MIAARISTPTICRAKAFQSCALLASTTTNATMTQASRSATAAEVIASRPTVVCVMPRSLRMRAITGNAVIDIAAATKSANGQKDTPGIETIG